MSARSPPGYAQSIRAGSQAGAYPESASASSGRWSSEGPDLPSTGLSARSHLLDVQTYRPHRRRGRLTITVRPPAVRAGRKASSRTTSTTATAITIQIHEAIRKPPYMGFSAGPRNPIDRCTVKGGYSPSSPDENVSRSPAIHRREPFE
jgi:hypothetical protein